MLKELHAYIIANVNVAGVYPDVLPQAVVLPAISYQVVSEVRRPTMQHRDNMPEVRVQFDSWGWTAVQARALATDLEDTIDGLKNTWLYFGSPPVGCYFAGIMAQSSFSQYENVTKMYRVSRDFKIWARNE